MSAQISALDYGQIIKDLDAALAKQHLVAGSLKEAVFYELSIFPTLVRIVDDYAVIINAEFDRISEETKQILNKGLAEGLLEIQQRLRNVNDVRTAMEFGCLDFMDTVLGRGAAMLAATKNDAEIVPRLLAVFEKSRAELTSIIVRTSVCFVRIYDNLATIGEKMHADRQVTDTVVYEALTAMTILEARNVLSDELLLGSSEMKLMQESIVKIVPELKV